MNLPAIGRQLDGYWTALGPLTVARVVGAVFVLLVGVLAVQSWHETTLKRELVTYQLAPAAIASAAAAAKVETVTVYLKAATAAARAVLDEPVRVDSQALAPKTAADTASAVAELPLVVAQLDTTRRTCNALMVSCDQFRAAAQVRFSADSVQISELKTALHGAEPGRLEAIWNKVKLPGALILGIKLGLSAR